MSRYDRSRHFEILVALRIAYGQLSADDQRSVISIDDVITYAEAVMTALVAEDALARLEAEAGAPEAAHSLLDPRD